MDNTIDMVRISIYLDILCYSWDKLYGQNSATITTVSKKKIHLQNVATLYQAIVRFLWQKNILSMDKLDYGKKVIAKIVNAIWNVVWVMI